MVEKISEAKSETELAAVEQQFNDILKEGLERVSAGKVDEGEVSAISLACQRLQYLMGQRRVALNGVNAAPSHA